MTHFIAVTGSGPSQRDLLAECKGELAERATDLQRFTGEWQDLFGALSTGTLRGKARRRGGRGRTPGALSRGSFETSSGPAATVCLLVFEKDLPAGLSSLPKDLLTVRKPAKVPFWPKERVSWLEREAKRRGVAISREAAQLLIEWTEDGVELLSELEKLAVASGGETIGAELVGDLVVDEGGRQMLSLLDGLCQGDVSAVIGAISFLREREEPLKMISALHKRMRLALYLSGATPEHARRVESALEATPFQVRQATKAASLSPRGRYGTSGWPWVSRAPPPRGGWVGDGTASSWKSSGCSRPSRGNEKSPREVSPVAGSAFKGGV